MDRAAWHIRAMREDDLAAISAIEQRCYLHPWSSSTVRQSFKVGYRGWAIEHVEGQVLLGYAWVQRIQDEAHLLNLCIDLPWQRQGLARALLDHLIDQAVDSGASVMFLEVRASHQRTIKLYARNGFNEIGRRERYYPAGAGREDALVMARHLDNSPAS